MGKHLKSPNNGTPDERLRGNMARHLDEAHGTVGHDMASVIHGATRITKSPAGPSCHLDKASHAMTTNAEASLGAGGGRLGDGARSIKSGAKAPCVDWGHIRKG
jgi:hypothetical protein